MIFLLISLSITALAYSGLGTINAENVNMRSGPSLNSEVLMVLTQGTIVNVHGTYNNWYEIDYNNNIGYVYTDYITIGEQDIIYTLTVSEIIPATEEIPTVTTHIPVVEVENNMCVCKSVYL